MTKEYSKGKSSTWDSIATSSAWEEMKLLYSDSEGEADQDVKDIGPSRVSPSGTHAEMASLGDGGEGVIVEDVVE